MTDVFFALLLSFLAIFLILLVLVQRGRGGGLAGALGGMGGSSAFGAKAGDVFTKITIITASIWIVVCLIAVFWAKHGGDAFSGTNPNAAPVRTEPLSPAGWNSEWRCGHHGARRNRNSAARIVTRKRKAALRRLPNRHLPIRATPAAVRLRPRIRRPRFVWQFAGVLCFAHQHDRLWRSPPPDGRFGRRGRGSHDQ